MPPGTATVTGLSPHIMVRYQATLAYDGTAFSGFQRQKGVRTVQGTVEDALRSIGWDGRTIYAAGRTDAGVHASGQVIAFDFDWQHALADLQNALNARLPEDAAIRAVEAVPAEFHPRYAAHSRTYRYRVFSDPVRDPLLERYAWRLWPAPDAESLAAAAALFPGEHDFSGFGTPPKAGGPTVRQVFASGWQFAGHTAVYTIEANAFLYRMVRRLVYAQVEAAQGRMSIDEIRHYLSGQSPEMVQGLAPGCGLTLAAVKYHAPPPEN